MPKMRIHYSEVSSVKEWGPFRHCSYNSDVQRAPPERADMYVAISIWAQTPPGAMAIHIAFRTPRSGKLFRHRRKSTIDCQNQPTTGNGCSEETFCAYAMLIFGNLKVYIIKLKFAQKYLKIRLR
jgi:hypothetical protein